MIWEMSNNQVTKELNTQTGFGVEKRHQSFILNRGNSSISPRSHGQALWIQFWVLSIACLKFWQVVLQIQELCWTHKHYRPSFVAAKHKLRSQTNANTLTALSKTRPRTLLLCLIFDVWRADLTKNNPRQGSKSTLFPRAHFMNLWSKVNLISCWKCSWQ